MQGDINSFYSAVGLARKAGRLTAGTEACLDGIRKGHAAVAVATEDAAENTLSKIRRACSESDTQFVVFGDSHGLSRAIGRSGIKVVIITDRELGKLIMSKSILNGDN